MARAAEGSGAGDLELLRQLSGAEPALALSAQRVQALLGERPAGEAAVLRPTAGLESTALCALINPLAGSAPLADLLARLELSPARPCEQAAVRLAKLARLLPAALVAPLRTGAAELSHWALEHGLLLVAVEEIRAHDERATATLRLVSRARVPLAGAENAELVAFRSTTGSHEHVAILIGQPDPGQPVLTRLHSECFTGDLLGSLRCDCGDQLRGAVESMAKAGGGVLLYLAQEGRGIGLANKLRAYALQDQGFDTIDANRLLGFAADERVYRPAAEMLRQLGFTRIRLMTNNPEKLAALSFDGIAVVERVPLAFPGNEHNEDYLRTKAVRSGHQLDGVLLPAAPGPTRPLT